MAWSAPPAKSTTPRAKANAPKLRRSMTDAEKRLWWHLLVRLPIDGTHFGKQMAIGPYVVDFICLERQLIIEVDGDQHGTDDAIAYDQRRDAYLKAGGYAVLRFSNFEVMRELEAVLDTIYGALNPTTPTPYPSPQGGGEFGEVRNG